VTERLADAIAELQRELQLPGDKTSVTAIVTAAEAVCRFAQNQPMVGIAFQWRDCDRVWPDQKCEWGNATLYAYQLVGETCWGVRGVCTDPLAPSNRWHQTEVGVSLDEAKLRAEALALEWFVEMADMRGLRVVSDAEVSEREALLARALDALVDICNSRHGLAASKAVVILRKAGRNV